MLGNDNAWLWSRIDDKFTGIVVLDCVCFCVRVRICVSREAEVNDLRLFTSLLAKIIFSNYM